MAKKDQNRRYYLKNKDKLLAKARIEKRWKKYNQTPKGFYNIIKKSSVKRGSKKLLTRDQFLDWYLDIPKYCHYCGITEDKLWITNSKRLEIDRKNNNLGYEKGNLVLACTWCNGVKGEFLTEDEMKIVGAIVMRPKWERKQ